MVAPFWKRSEIWGLIVALVVLLAVLTLVYRDWKYFLIASAETDRTGKVVDLLSETFSDVQDLETGQRGYLLVGEEAYLEPYQRARSVLQSKLAQLLAATAGDAPQTRHAQQLNSLVDQKITELQRSVDARRDQGAEAARAIVQTGKGRMLMDQIRAEVAALKTEGLARVAADEHTAETYRLRAAYTAALGSALLFVLLVLAAVLVRNRSEDRERALTSLLASKRETDRIRQLLQTTLQSIGDAVITTDLEGRITFLNAAAESVTEWDLSCQGLPVDEVFRIINEYTREPVESPIEKVRRTGLVAGLANHTLLLTRTGREVPIDDSGAPIREPGGPVSGFVLVFRDISKRREAEKALTLSENNFRTMANAAPVLLWLSNPDGSVHFLNHPWSAFTGRSTEADLHEGWIEALHPEDRERFLAARKSALERVTTHSTECRLRRADGEYRSVICTEAPRYTPDGVHDGFVAACFDISELKQAQRSLELSEHRFRSLVAGTTSMVWQSGANGRSETPLPDWERFTGQTFEQYRYGGGIDAMHPDDRKAVEAVWIESLQKRQPFYLEYRLWHQPSAGYRNVVSRGVPLKSPEGEVVEWIGTLTDVTEQRQFEEKLRDAAKLESLGVLAGGIAHDFNNLLVGVLGNASLLEDNLTDPEQREVARQILLAGERAAVLTKQMLAYSGRGRFLIEATDLAAEIRQILPLVLSAIPKHVEVRVNAPPAIPLVDVDRAQFQQLVMNLVINGAEAVENAYGTVNVTLSEETLEERRIAREAPHEDLPPGRYVVMQVRDTGKGMDDVTRAKIFDPFFTTKFTGRGLGLAAVLGIIKGHRGLITVTSAVGSGSIFRVYLPAAAAGRRLAAAPELPAAPALRSTTALVVDDEQVVRDLARRALEDNGIQVLLATNGREAAEVLEKFRDKVSVILLDLAMPVMSGEEALPRLRAIQPAARILASSGFSELEAAQRFGDSIDGFIQKPYTTQALLAALRKAVDKPSGPVGEPTGAL